MLNRVCHVYMTLGKIKYLSVCKVACFFFTVHPASFNKRSKTKALFVPIQKTKLVICTLLVETVIKLVIGFFFTAGRNLPFNYSFGLLGQLQQFNAYISTIKLP